MKSRSAGSKSTETCENSCCDRGNSCCDRAKTCSDRGFEILAIVELFVVSPRAARKTARSIFYRYLLPTGTPSVLERLADLAYRYLYDPSPSRHWFPRQSSVSGGCDHGLSSKYVSSSAKLAAFHSFLNKRTGRFHRS
jgi:hypothetical protein